MKRHQTPHPPALLALLVRSALLLGLAAVALADPAAADDRDLLRSATGDPYVFILVDTSGSMHWSTECSAADLAAGNCRMLCPTRDCYTPLNGDDPASKFYQAKEALYEVLSSVDDINFGFGSFNQNDLGMRAKHWLYEAVEGGPVIPGFGAYPAIGQQDVFGLGQGEGWNCTAGSNVGCAPGNSNNNANPADLDNQWEAFRMLRLPKAGIDFDRTTVFYVRHAGVMYEVAVERDSGAYGDATIEVDVEIDVCTDLKPNSCTTQIDDINVTYKLVSDFNSWDFNPPTAFKGLQESYFDQGPASDTLVNASSTCDGWDPNTDTAADDFGGYNIRFPNQVPAPANPLLVEGDVLPLSWTDDNKSHVMHRLAPNIGPPLNEVTPDFRTARYFNDERLAGENFLRLKNGNGGPNNEGARPLVAWGSTPLGFSLGDFRLWYAGCLHGPCPKASGWQDVAAANDPDWACRQKYLLVITDGDDTCPGRDPCSFTASLRANENVKTFVVGFGVQNTPGNRLTCMASNGGTGEPIFPQNKQQLVDALTAIFGQIKEEARAFASAAVPTVQAEVADKIYLSSFTPLNASSVWDGHLDAFLKPLPIDPATGRPDESQSCGTTSCHLWDSGTEILAQAPTAAQVASNNLKLGPNADERRVLHPEINLTGESPHPMRMFEPPAGALPIVTPLDMERADLWSGLGVSYDLLNPLSWPAAETEANDAIKFILQQKQATINHADGTTTDVTFVLGDIFHSNPTVIDNPADFKLFAADVFGDGTTCSAGNPGYRCFSLKHQRRRKMLGVGANDGQLHVFEAGIFDPSDDTFSNGSGMEVLSVIPRSVLPVVKELSDDTRQIFGVDNTTRVIDVFLDPVHTGTPDIDEREWRTVGVAGLREGGWVDGGGRVQLDNGKPFTSGYFAVDLTQPDKLDSSNEPINQDLVPTCLSAYNAGQCGPVPFGSVLWEFTDSVGGSPAEFGVSFDEDLNGSPDLADTWSVPILVRIKLLDSSNNPEERTVAIFGGGFDAVNRASPQSGTWLYIVDLETGEAIYKEVLEGAAAATPAVVDTNRDGLADTVYIGTTAGFLYKVRMDTVVQPTTKTVKDLAGNDRTVVRIDDAAWKPFKIFDTGGRPLFFAPTVLFLAEKNLYALAFGDGDREQLWAMNGVEGRFYMILDTGFQSTTAGLPRTEADFQFLDSEDVPVPTTSDFVINPQAGKEAGWVMALFPNERVVTQSFSLAGVTIFGTFEPEVTVTSGGECARTGDSRIFVIFSNNANPILPQSMTATLTQSRYMVTGEALVTPPFAEQRATKNPADASKIDPQRKQWEAEIVQTLKGLFPARARFSNRFIDVSFVRSDTGIVGPIPIPIGIVEKNWKEF